MIDYIIRCLIAAIVFVACIFSACYIAQINNYNAKVDSTSNYNKNKIVETKADASCEDDEVDDTVTKASEKRNKEETKKQKEEEKLKKIASIDVYKDGFRDCLTKSRGVYYYNGHKETWYSSKVLYHYKTPEWICGADGIWRDKDGYIIIASNDYKQGTLIETSLGTGIVKDNGCASGTIDVYVSW